jgi:hypothetical protein
MPKWSHLHMPILGEVASVRNERLIQPYLYDELPNSNSTSCGGAFKRHDTCRQERYATHSMPAVTCNAKSARALRPNRPSEDLRMGDFVDSATLQCPEDRIHPIRAPEKLVLQPKCRHTKNTGIERRLGFVS